MTEHRRVVVADAVLYSVDDVLPQAPTAGRPSRARFISTDLLEAVEQFAVGWDDLAPLILGRDDYRVLISRGRLVYAFVVEGQLASDGTVELVSIELDVAGPALDASRKGVPYRARSGGGGHETRTSLAGLTAVYAGVQ